MGFQVPNFDGSGMGGDDDDDDDDLEAELQKLQQGDRANPKSRGSKSDQRQLGLLYFLNQKYCSLVE